MKAFIISSLCFLVNLASAQVFQDRIDTNVGAVRIILDRANRNFPVYRTDYTSILHWEKYQKRLVYAGVQFSF